MVSRLREIQACDGIRRMFKPPEWEWSQTGDVGWWSRDGWGDVLLSAHGLRLDEWREEGRLAIINSGPHCVVYRVDLAQGSIYVKHFLVPDGGPHSASGSDVARVETKASAPSNLPRLEYRRSRRSLWVNSGSASVCRELFW